jgi:hypothetical protein
MKKVIAEDDERVRRRYVASTRHTIQVDYRPYMRTIARERKRGRRRAGAADRAYKVRQPTPA